MQLREKVTGLGIARVRSISSRTTHDCNTLELRDIGTALKEKLRRATTRGLSGYRMPANGIGHARVLALKI